MRVFTSSWHTFATGRFGRDKNIGGNEKDKAKGGHSGVVTDERDDENGGESQLHVKIFSPKALYYIVSMTKMFCLYYVMVCLYKVAFTILRMQHLECIRQALEYMKNPRLKLC